MAELKYDVKKNLGVLGGEINGWSKKINLISWNERKAKADIRDWDASNEKMRKGITLTKAELIDLKKILLETDLESLDMA
ncbi:MAG: PC4/YdbC family ssDNA-binding protein [Candidatus Delongbacteria bacterium]|jgi:hypothetical protein|nr:PC4/YdbC family ssDNA-binding protein [Candidatus Delongbacteria bacterium]NOR45529.1 hypothetical protein [Candidatus Delongbacteria bacterium]